MQLFAEAKRTRQEYRARGESLFSFYDSCGRPGYEDLRGLISSWLGQMPDDAQAELIVRIQNGGDRDFGAAILELMVHVMLVRLGQQVVVHPVLPGTNKRPDFKAHHPETGTLTYVEATTINRSQGDDAEENRETPLYNAINNAQLPPGCFLGYELLAANGNSPSINRVAAGIRAWALDNEEAARTNSISNRFEFDGWTVELELFSGLPDDPPGPAIGVVHDGPGWMAPHLDIRSALERKADRYGPMNSPYLISLADLKNPVWGGGDGAETVLQALLGDEVIEVAEGRAPRLARKRNGFWFAGGEPRNQNVSGVLALPSIELWALRSQLHQPIFAINPWANDPLPKPFCTLGHLARKEDGRWRLHEGEALADVLGVPSPWPPQEWENPRAA